jgi:hypothetical protein
MDMTELSELNKSISFNYTCFDRCIFRGYLHNLFPIGGVVNYYRSININSLNKDTLKIPTNELVSHIEKYANQNNIPIEWWNSVSWKYKTDGGKSAYVESKYLNDYKGFENKIFTIIATMEKTYTIENSKRQSSKTLYRVQKQVKFYYIYFYDSVLGGLCYLKICTYVPFEMEFYCNGHHYIAHNLCREGVSYKMEGNCFTDCEKPERLQELGKQITGAVVLERCEYWKQQFFKFNKGSYSKENPKFQHQWYSSQIEISTNLIFKDKTFGRDFFNKMILLFSVLQLADVLTKVFSARPRNYQSKTTQRRYDLNAVIKHWFRGNSIKMYNKTGTLIRIETTINHPAKMGGKRLKKGIMFLQSLFWRGMECNERYLQYCNQINLNTVSSEQLDNFKQTITKSNGKNVAAPDLRKDRQLELLCVLILPKFIIAPFRLKEVKRYLSGYFTKSNQIRYEIEKLLVRGLVEKMQTSNYYQVTEDGFAQIWSLIMTYKHFHNPLLSRGYKIQYSKLTGKTLKFEQGYDDIKQGLRSIFTSLSMLKTA